MRRRGFIHGIASCAAWPLVARAQQGERMRQVGMLLSSTADDAAHQTWVGAFRQGLAQSGWIIGRNVGIETRDDDHAESIARALRDKGYAVRMG